MFLKFLIFTFGSPKIFRDPATPRLEALKTPASKERYYSIFSRLLCTKENGGSLTKRNGASVAERASFSAPKERYQI